jgi:hypothetical protein
MKKASGGITIKVTSVRRHDRTHIKIKLPININRERKKILTFVDTIVETN